MRPKIANGVGPLARAQAGPALLLPCCRLVSFVLEFLCNFRGRPVVAAAVWRTFPLQGAHDNEDKDFGDAYGGDGDDERRRHFPQ